MIQFGLLWLLSTGCTPPKRVEIEAAPVYETREGRNRVRLDVVEALLEHGKTKEAREVLAVAIEENASDAEVSFLQGWALYLEGLSSEAEPLLASAAKRMEGDARPLRWLALIHAETGRIDEAISEFQQVVKLSQNDAASWNNLGFLLLSTNQTKEARAALSKAVALDGENEKYRMNLAFSLVALGEDDEALAAFRAVTNEADAQVNLGVAYELAGNLERARLFYQTALKVDPDNKPALSALKRMDGESSPPLENP